MCRTLLSSSRRASWPTTQTAHERALPLEEGLVCPTELMSRCRSSISLARVCHDDVSVATAHVADGRKWGHRAGSGTAHRPSK